jgi:hypothetical protein
MPRPGIRIRRAGCLAAVAAAVLGMACREVVYDILTNERLVRVPRSSRNEITIETGRIELPSKLGTDKTIDSSTLNLTGTNLNLENAVDVDISAASSNNPNVFGEIATGFHLEPGETRSITVVQTEPDDPLVTASQSDAVNIRFDSTSQVPGVGELEFRFTIRVLAHKDTPGTGAGTLIFY